jgi:hypothetical protein
VLQHLSAAGLALQKVLGSVTHDDCQVKWALLLFANRMQVHCQVHLQPLYADMLAIAPS